MHGHCYLCLKLKYHVYDSEQWNLIMPAEPIMFTVLAMKSHNIQSIMFTYWTMNEIA
jgi:hypothetical protein